MSRGREPELDAFLRELLEADPGALELLADCLPPTAPPPALRDRLLATADGCRQLDRFAGRVSELLQVDPDRARALLDRSRGQDGWRPLLPGVLVQPVAVGDSLARAGWIASFVRMSAGSVLPDHRHFGAEHSLIFEGSCVNSGNGQTLRAGDELRESAHSRHSIEVLDGPDLFFLALIEHGFAMADRVVGREP